MSYDKIMELASRKSLFYQASEIYPNSPAGFWDFGPIGASIRRKIIEVWRKELVQKEDMLEIHGAQILPKQVYEGSGHLTDFKDPIVQCLKCKKYERADQLITKILKKEVPEATPLEKLNELIKNNNIKCDKCKGELSEVKHFSLMVESIIGRGELKTFLRPEACQSIFLNFVRMHKTMRLKLPQGIAQVGGAFRNEISPRQSITRAIEFTQMEAEVFFNPKEINEIGNWDEIKDYELKILRLNSKKVENIKAKELVSKKIVQGKLIAYYLARTQQLFDKLGIPLDKMRFREVDKDERAFYSLLTFDFEVETSLGWLELVANNYRTDYDIKRHQEYSKTKLEYTFEDGKKLIPYIWEISAGVDRTLYTVLECSLKNGKEGDYLALNPIIAPYQVAIFPLVKKDQLPELAKKIDKDLKNKWTETFYDEAASVGRRYARADEIGIPYAVTIDHQSLRDNTVTLRYRDTGKQIRIKIEDIHPTLISLIWCQKELSDFGKFIN
ncbi:glycine--tRNA ligase [Candidatus Woesearchaeota archaeon]|nr:glycine--tRNA ligase [Candidatus Woesearchaeota archaeon]